MNINPLVPELYVADFDRSLAFYRDMLDFQIMYMRAEERFAFLEREGAQLMIEQSTDPARIWAAAELAHPYGRGINLQIRVRNVDALHQSLAAASISFFVALEDKWYRRDEELVGNRQFVIQDPDGYLLRFYGDLGARPVMRA
ncbi:MAG: VOC family protein [Parvibaculum sp.]|uniref:bleomycin resistance protein n=1 Tax=Parvibaculum sp. TaxID=2024848 RepID=UPI003C7890BC